jgi:hypothetical protein
MELYRPPEDYLTQVIPATIGVTISFMAIIELSDRLGAAHVRAYLLPLCVMTFAVTILTLASLLLWYQERDYEGMLRPCLLALAGLRCGLYSLNAFIYVVRVTSILMFHHRLRVILVVVTVLRGLWLCVLMVMDLVKVAGSPTAESLFRTVTSSLSKVTAFSQLSWVVIQALCVDGVLVYVIVKTIRATGRRVAASAKRIVRIALLTIVCILVVVLRATGSESIALLSLVSSVTGNIVSSLEAFVNIDLYLLDMALFSAPADPVGPLPLSAQSARLAPV